MYSLSLILGQIYNCGVKLVLKTENMMMFFLIKRLHKMLVNKKIFICSFLNREQIKM